MLSWLYPDDEIRSVYEADYERLYREGYRAALYDIDNTLVLHDAGANDEARSLFTRLHEIGWRACLISNNHRERVQSFAEQTEADFFLCDAHKPSAWAYLRAAELLGLDRSELLFFGDQLFTDIWGAKRAGIRSVLVRPIGAEKLLQIRLKRILERPILAAYRRKRLRQEKTGGARPLL